MLTKGKVLRALKQVEEPDLRQNIVDLNIVKSIKIKRKNIDLDLSLITQGYSSKKANFEEKIKEVLSSIGAKSISLRFNTMTKKEQADLAEKLKGSKIASNTQGPSLMNRNSQTTFIAVSSGKGGVGKSTVTVNLAVALANQGWRVGLIDADIYGYSVPQMMGITEKPLMIDSLTLPVEKYGVKVISMGFFNQPEEPVMWRGPMLGKTLRYFFEGVYWPKLDYMLIDLPPGTGDIALDIHTMLPRSKDIIVSTPQTTASHIAERAGSMAIRNKRELIGVVENMSYLLLATGEKEYIFGKNGATELANSLDTELLVQVPIGAPNHQSFDSNDAYAVYHSESVHGEIFGELADKVILKTSYSKAVQEVQ
ncbi:P-loop NTPase [Scopulibacillus cellulosilyticus]|uniref:Iron-sulfur cluster carrier protein n=1 Tax=Scopulibacillus cellulosilyticus TaxID=2665665 RepID=A0ABW2Q0T8_9BACL